MGRPKKIKAIENKEVIMDEVPVMDHVSELETIEKEMDRVRVELEDTKRQLEEKKQEMKAMPAREISEDEMVIIKKQIHMTAEQKALKEKIAKEKVYDNVPTTGKFINRRSPGNSAKLTYMKYADDPVKWYVFEDGKVYTIPRGFVDQIKEYYHTPHFIQKAGEMDPNKPQSAIHDVDTSNKKYDFVPVNF